MKKLLLTLLACALLTSCADVETIDKCTTGHEYGFWGGLWHGAIFIFSFFGSLFSDDIAIYAVNNTGGWYDFGFFLGLGSIGSSTSAATRKR